MKHVKKLKLNEEFSPEYEDEDDVYICTINGRDFENQFDNAIDMTLWALKKYVEPRRQIDNCHFDIITRKK